MNVWFIQASCMLRCPAHQGQHLGVKHHTMKTYAVPGYLMEVKQALKTSNFVTIFLVAVIFSVKRHEKHEV